MAQNARVTVSISGVATDADLQAMEDRIMTALSDALASLQAAVDRVVVGTGGDRIAELERALADERAAATALAAAESAEDVDQEAALAESRAATDAALAEIAGAVTDLSSVTDQLNSIGTAVDEAPDDAPVSDVTIPDAPAPAPDEAPTPVTPPAPDAPVDAVPEEDVPTVDDTATPTPPADAPADGPTDADGNPVAPPGV